MNPLTPKFDPILKIFEKMKKVQQKKTCAKGLLTFTTFQCDQKLEFRELFEKTRFTTFLGFKRDDHNPCMAIFSKNLVRSTMK